MKDILRRSDVIHKIIFINHIKDINSTAAAQNNIPDDLLLLNIFAKARNLQKYRRRRGYSKFLLVSLGLILRCCAEYMENTPLVHHLR